MNIMFKNTHNVENKLLSNSELQRTTSSSFNNKNGECPLGLKSSQDLSFKGHSSAQNKITGTVAEAVKTYGEDFGESAGKYIKEVIEKESKLKKSGLEVKKDGTVDFKDQTLGKKVFEIVTYPVVQMPFDLANAVVSGMRKVPGLKNMANKLDTPFLQEKRAISNSKSNVAAIQHYFELLGKENEGKRLTEGHKGLTPLVTNYNAQTERSLNRLVTGLIPAFFLANDAYNLSMYVKNNKDDAKVEKKRRFNQELGRILMSTAATYGVMSLFAKQCNQSIGVISVLTAGPVLVSEILGRKLAGNPVLPVSVKSAKEYAQKRKESNQSENTYDLNNPQSQQNIKAKKGGLTLNNILKTLGGLVVLGFAAEKTSNTKGIKAKLDEFNKWYSGLITKDFTISRKEFNELTNKLENNGFSKIAKFHKEAVQQQTGDTIKLGTVNDKTKYVLIHQILAFPAKFVWKVLNLPYSQIVKPILNTIQKQPMKLDESKNNKILQANIEYLQMIKNNSSDDFKKKVNERLFSSYDNLTKSNLDSSNLNIAVKTVASSVTTGFLIADNYNIVMVDSQGQNKDLAEQKAKERAIQRGVRLTYEAFAMKLIFDMFTGASKSSLLFSLGLSGALRAITEMVERKAVGLPIKESSREEIKENEQIYLSATGLKGKYFRAMAKLSGKKNFVINEKKYV